MTSENQPNNSFFIKIMETWPQLNFYERFEYLVSLSLMLLISMIVIFSLFHLGTNIYTMLVINALDPLDFSVFQMIFGNILTLLIAMEFMNSIHAALYKKGQSIEVRTILLIAMLAISRKFIVMDSKTTSAETMAALAVVLLALGGVYWLIKIIDRNKID